MITRKRIFFIAVLFSLLSLSHQTNPDITLSQKQAYVSNIDFSITFNDENQNDKSIYVFLNCPSQIRFDPVVIKDKEARVTKKLSENEVISLLGDSNQIECIFEFVYADSSETFSYKDKNVTLVKEVKKKDDVTFSYLDERKKIAYKKIKINANTEFSYQIVSDSLAGNITPLTDDNIITLDETKTFIYIIVFNKEKEIVYITDELEIINEKEITFDYLRSYYIIENFNQKISSYLSSSKSVIIQSISEVFYQKDESKLPLSQVLPAFSEKSSEFSTEVTINNNQIGDHTLHIVLLDYDVTVDTQQIHIVDSIDKLIHTEAITVADCTYYNSSYSFKDIVNTNITLDLSLDYVQGNTVHHFKNVNNVFTLSASNLNDVGAGKTEIKVYDHKEVDIPLYTKSFTATNIVLDASSKETIVSPTIRFSGLSCDATSIPLSVKLGESTIELSCSNFESSTMTCSTEPPLSAGEYLIQVNKEINLDHVTIYTEGDSSQITIALPTDIKQGENTITISSSDDVEKIKQIKVKRNNAQILDEYNKPGSTVEAALKYFTYDDEKKNIFLVLNLEQDMKYIITQIILDTNEIINFKDDEYVIAHYFTISSKYFFYSSSSKFVTLKFNSLSQAINNQNLIKYKIDESGTPTDSSCTLNETNLILSCQFTTTETSQKAYFGINSNLLSSQTIYFLTADVNGVDGCYSYVETSIDTPITVKITSQEDLNNKIKLYIDETETNVNQAATDVPFEYVFNVNIQRLAVGSHTLYIRVNDGVSIEVPNSMFNIQKVLEITLVSPDTIYFTTDPQILTIGFTGVITNEEISRIILKNSIISSNPIELTPTSFTGNYNLITVPVTLLSSQYIKGTYSILYKSQCGQEVDTGKTIKLNYNEIVKVTPSSLYIPDLKTGDISFTVSYKYPPAVSITGIKLGTESYSNINLLYLM